MNRRSLCCALALLGYGAVGASAWSQTVPRLADGSVTIVGDKTLEPVLMRLAELYTRRHPEVRFTFLLKNPPVGVDGIIAGVSLFAPVAHEAWDGEVDAFKRLYGYRPVDVRIGRLGYAGPGRENPPAIYVNAANPLLRLTIDEVGRIFTAGQMPSDLRHWSQLGVGGKWAKHAIHVYGTRDDGLNVTTLRSTRFGGRPFVRHYEALADDADVLEALAGDRYGIGLVWSADSQRIPKDVRMVPLAVSAAAVASTAQYAEVRAGHYPLSQYIHVYLANAPGRPVDPVAKEYLRLALSAEGQLILDELKNGRPGFVPLTTAEARGELAKLE